MDMIKELEDAAGDDTARANILWGHGVELRRILKDAIAASYHACDESVPSVDEPRHGCACWVAEAKLRIGFEGG